MPRQSMPGRPAASGRNLVSIVNFLVDFMNSFDELFRWTLYLDLFRSSAKCISDTHRSCSDRSGFRSKILPFEDSLIWRLFRSRTLLLEETPSLEDSCARFSVRLLWFSFASKISSFDSLRETIRQQISRIGRRIGTSNGGSPLTLQHSPQNVACRLDEGVPLRLSRVERVHLECDLQIDQLGQLLPRHFSLGRECSVDRATGLGWERWEDDENTNEPPPRHTQHTLVICSQLCLSVRVSNDHVAERLAASQPRVHLSEIEICNLRTCKLLSTDCINQFLLFLEQALSTQKLNIDCVLSFHSTLIWTSL